MRFLEIDLWTNTLEEQALFYKDALGLDIQINENTFSVQIGWTKLTFRRSVKKFIYHYCFLIPSNHLENLITWSKNRLSFINVDGSVIVNQSKSWNAQSVYFYDGSGNIGEFIVRHDLENTSDKAFDTNQILCFNEIGLCSQNNEKNNSFLENEYGSDIYTGQIERFVTHGDKEGLFLIIDYTKKETWFPTTLKTEFSPFILKAEHNDLIKTIEFNKEELKLLYS